MVRFLKSLAALAAALILMPVHPLAAELYQWTDENGIRHYSNIAHPARGKISRGEETIQRLSPGARFTAIRVFDGDTIEAKGWDLTFKVRLVGIDAPEKGRKGQAGQPFAQQAKQALERMVKGKQLRLKQYGTGGYNRVLAEVWTDTGNLNIKMLKRGMAEVYGGRMPPGLNTGAYHRAQAKARARGTGIWSLGKKYKSPRQWRRENPWK